MPITIPVELANVLDRARQLSFLEARQLSSLYDRGPGTPGADARQAADAAAKEFGLGEARVSWLKEAGRAVQEAEIRDPWDATHDEPWRWATQTVLDVARATLVKGHISAEVYELLIQPWREAIPEGGGAARAPRAQETSGVAGHSVDLPFLDERIESGERLLEAAILERASYVVAYLVIEAADGTCRVTHRGTGQYDDFFDTLIAHDRWEADREVDLLKTRFNLMGPNIAPDVRYYRDSEAAVAALQTLGD